jgi:hypothetical protein
MVMSASILPGESIPSREEISYAIGDFCPMGAVLAMIQLDGSAHPSMLILVLACDGDAPICPRPALST